MDLTTFLGVALAVGAILVGQHLEGGHAAHLLNFPAFLIVTCGTLGAAIVETPMSIFLKSIGLLKWFFFPPKFNSQENIQKIVEWSNIARKEGLLGLEAVIEAESDEFIKKGLQLLVDGSEPEAFRKILERDVESKHESYELAIKMYESMGGYCPTIGIIGAVLGLIHVMQSLTDPSKLGIGIAVAFVATIYGVGLANIVFLPLANRFNKLNHKKTIYYEMLVEGLVSISLGENPRLIELKLNSFI